MGSTKPCRAIAVVAIACAAVSLVPTAALAAGFALIEQNARGVGTAFAGSAAAADDAGILFFNPAGLGELDSLQLMVAAHGIDLSAEFEDRGSQLPPAGLGALPAGSTSDDAGDLSGVPNLYLAGPLGERFAIGIGVNAPFGLTTEYDDPWVGRFQGIKSELETINVNPALSFRVSDALLLGIGANYQMAEATLTNAVMLGAGIEGRARVELDDEAWGWNVGVLWSPAATTRIGLSWRSKLDYDLEGDTTVTTLAGTALPAASGPTAAKLTTPEQVFLSAVQGLGDRWRVLADVSWTRWSRVSELAAINPATGTPRDVLRFGFEDAWRAALGASYEWSERWVLRGGLAWDESPVADEFRTVRLPDEDRIWIALGARWRPSERVSVDAGYARIFIDDPVVDLIRPQTGAPAAFTSVVRGDYDSSVGVYSVQLNWTFAQSR